jgi:hypothetical protein
MIMEGRVKMEVTEMSKAIGVMNMAKAAVSLTLGPPLHRCSDVAATPVCTGT